LDVVWLVRIGKQLVVKLIQKIGWSQLRVFCKELDEKAKRLKIAGLDGL